VSTSCWLGGPAGRRPQRQIEEVSWVDSGHGADCSAQDVLRAAQPPRARRNRHRPDGIW
jgi:hypothetical protein